MNKEFIPYEQALELKDLGFDEECLDKYDPRFEKLSSDMQTWTTEHYPETLMIPAPLYQQAFRWFREKHGLHGIPREWTLDKFSYEIKSNREGAMTFEVYGGYPLIFKTYEEAELACLNRLIEIVKQN
jgi:hypothetical protein